jgi:diacylglycerol kinase
MKFFERFCNILVNSLVLVLKCFQEKFGNDDIDFNSIMTANKAKNVFESFNYALNGIEYALKTQRNLRIHSVIAVLVIILSGLLSLSNYEWAIVVLCISLVFFAELSNTALEVLMDSYYGDKLSELAKNAKDIAAGAVFCSAMGSSIVGILIFVPKILGLIVL